MGFPCASAGNESAYTAGDLGLILSLEDLLEKGKATHSSILAWSIKKQRHYFADKGPPNQSYGFSSSYVWMWELDHKESWVPKNWCFWTVVLEKSPLDYKVKPVPPKGNQSWIFIGRTDVETGMPMLWPPDAKNWLIGKDPDAGKDWRREEKGTTEDEMVWWHHWLNGHEFEQAPGVGDGQGRLQSTGSQRVYTTEWLNCTEWVQWHQRLLEYLISWGVCMC